MRRWDNLVEKYLAQEQARGIAAATIYQRQRELARFGLWLKARKPRPALEDVSSEHIVHYLEARGAFRSRATVAGSVSILRSMGEFLVVEGLWRSSPLRWMEGPKMHLHRPVPRRIDKANQQALWAAAQQLRQEHARYQAVCVLAILYGTGLRRGELERLDLSHWDRETRVLRVDGQKTGVERAVPVADGVARCIEAYLPHRHNRLESKGRVGEPAMLVNTLGGRMTGQMVSSLVQRLSKLAGLEHVTLHQFRHSCASDLLEAGVTLPEVQKILGHAVIATTVRYTAIADTQRAEAMSRHPLNRFLATPPEERKAS